MKYFLTLKLGPFLSHCNSIQDHCASVITHLKKILCLILQKSMCLSYIFFTNLQAFPRDTSKFVFRITLPLLVIWIILVTIARFTKSTRNLEYNKNIYYTYQSIAWAGLQGSMRTLIFLFVLLGVIWGSWKSGLWNHLKTCSFTYLVGDSGGQLRPQLRLLARYLSLASPCSLCFPTTWWLGFHSDKLDLIVCKGLQADSAAKKIHPFGHKGHIKFTICISILQWLFLKRSLPHGEGASFQQVYHFNKNFPDLFLQHTHLLYSATCHLFILLRAFVHT